MEFRVLGPLELVDASGQVKLGGMTQRATLGYLLLHVNRWVSTSQLLSALWRGRPPRTARTMVHNAISGLRAAFHTFGSPPEILTYNSGYKLVVEPSSVDLLRFRSLAGRGWSEVSAGEWETGSVTLRAALELWQGRALADLAEFGISWPELEMVQHEYYVALECYCGSELMRGFQHEVINRLEHELAATPWLERLCGLLMLSFCRQGLRVDALNTYQRTRNALITRQGREPNRELQRLNSAILAQESNLMVGHLGDFCVGVANPGAGVQRAGVPLG